MLRNRRENRGALRAGARWLAWTIPLGVVAGSLVWNGRTHTLEASGSWAVDSDADGLPDAQELILETSPNAQDSDGDGFVDALEFAAQSDPNDGASIPLVQDVAVGLSARGGDPGRAIVLFGIYAADGVLDSEMIRFGRVHSGMLVSVPFAWLLTRANTKEIAIPSGGTVLLVEVELPTNLIARMGHVSYFSAVGMPGQPHYQSADVLDFAWQDGLPLIGIEVGSGGGGGTLAQTQGQVYRPIPSQGTDVPNDWNPGEICYRTSETVGTSGAVITQEVTSAECHEGWDSYCSPGGCSSSVGSTYQTVDPLALVGG